MLIYISPVFTAKHIDCKLETTLLSHPPEGGGILQT